MMSHIHFQSHGSGFAGQEKDFNKAIKLSSATKGR